MYILKRFLLLQIGLLIMNYILFLLFYGLSNWHFNILTWPTIIKALFLVCNVFTAAVNVSFAYASWERQREEMKY